MEYYESHDMSSVVRLLQDDEDDSSPTDSTLVRRTLRLYGSMYGGSLLLFLLLRRRFPRAFNIRSWSKTQGCKIAHQTYANDISWLWQVFQVSDIELHEQCGLDAVCFLRALRFGRKLTIMGCLQAIYLIPIYYTANRDSEIDIFSKISIDNLDSSSKRLLATVVAAYICFLYTMHLILVEYRWYTSHRHKFLSEITPRNYSVYVSGIPEVYQSSQQLHTYFSQCSKHDAVLEAHIVMDTPKLDKLVARRKANLQRLDHVLEMEKSNGKTRFHFELSNGRVETAGVLRNQINDLNRTIAKQINGILGVSAERLRCELNRQESNLHGLLAAIQHDVNQDDDEVTRFSRNTPKTPTTPTSNTLDDVLPHLPDMTPKDGDQERRRANLGADICSDDGDDDVNDDSDDEVDSNTMGGQTNGETTVVQILDDDGSLVQALVDQDGSLVAVLSNDEEQPYQSSPVRVANMLRKNIMNGTYKVVGNVGNAVVVGSRVAGTGLVMAGSGLAKSGERVVHAVGSQGVETLRYAQTVSTGLGATVVNSAGAVVPSILNRSDGTPRDAGFVVFNSLYATQMALQMVHHPKPYVMSVTPAPDPKDLFWRNVGLPHQAKRSGIVAAVAATSTLCFFWSIPMGFITTLTKVQSLKDKLPRLGAWMDENPWAEGFFSQLAPLLLLTINEVILPSILKYFATWEGHISTAILEASLFNKLCCFMIIQTFFVSAISGGITDEISAIIDQPNLIIGLLADSLAAQSNLFIQICLAMTFLMQSFEMLRIYPLSVALLRRFFGPNATEKEREQVWWMFHPLCEPPEFWHAETFAQLVVFYIVFFVYNTISPVTCFFLLVCFVLTEAGYRYQFIHNYPRSFDTGGQLWKHFIAFILAIMVIAQLTLVGLLASKNSQYASPGVLPLLGITGLFIFFINNKHGTVAKHLPTRNCILRDSENNAEREMDMSFVKGEYLQPSLQNKVDLAGKGFSMPRQNPDSRANVLAGV